MSFRIKDLPFNLQGSIVEMLPASDISKAMVSRELKESILKSRLARETLDRRGRMQEKFKENIEANRQWRIANQTCSEYKTKESCTPDICKWNVGYVSRCIPKTYRFFEKPEESVNQTFCDYAAKELGANPIFDSSTLSFRGGIKSWFFTDLDGASDFKTLLDELGDEYATIKKQKMWFLDIGNINPQISFSEIGINDILQEKTKILKLFAKSGYNLISISRLLKVPLENLSSDGITHRIYSIDGFLVSSGLCHFPY